MPKSKNEIIVTESHFAHVSFLDKLWFGITGKRYRYEIEITYYYEQFDNGQWNGEKYVSRVIQHGTASQKSLDFDYRHLLHKQAGELLMKEMPRDLLKNGILKITRIDYLGRW
jgi:hypothetical protein